jgi:hypothetical protein
MADARERRMAANEMLARRINEMVEYERPRNGDSGDHFVCECCVDDCAEKIDIDVAAYSHVRSNPRRFIVRDGHDNPEIESVVERYPDYVVVQKRGEAGRLAEAGAAES